MAPTSALALALLALASFLRTGECLRCWQCSSDASAHCGDPFDKSDHHYQLVDCDRDRSHTSYLSSSRTHPICKKVKRTVNSQTVVVRSCGWKGTEDSSDTGCDSHAQSYGDQCFTCDTDECNAGVRLESLGLPLALGAASFYRLLG